MDQSLAYNVRGVGWILIGLATWLGWFALATQRVDPVSQLSAMRPADNRCSRVLNIAESIC